MGFLFWKSEKDKEVERFLQDQKREFERSNERDKKYEELYNQLTPKEKEKINNLKADRIFPSRSDFIGWKNMEMEFIIKTRKSFPK